jgi:hypothetical protein
MDSEFPSNKYKDRQSNPKVKKPQEKKVEQVVVSKVVRRKKPLSKKFTETFVGGDSKSVWEYVAFDVLVPAAKDTIAEAVSSGVERMIFGDSHRSRRGRGRGETYTSYNKISSGRGRDRPEISRRARTRHDFDEIILGTRAEATEVIDQLFEILAKYDTVTVADLYELVGITGNYTDDKWGWFDLRGAGVSRIANGYLLDLPKPEPLD